MIKVIRFPVKGTYYYSAALAMDLDLLQNKQLLEFELEPANQHDKNAIQIWLPKTPSKLSDDTQDTDSKGLLLGYLPRLLAKTLHRKIQHQQVAQLQIEHFAQLGSLTEIDCSLEVDFSKQDKLTARLLFIQLYLLTLLANQIHHFKRWKQRHFSVYKHDTK